MTADRPPDYSCRAQPDLHTVLEAIVATGDGVAETLSP